MKTNQTMTYGELYRPAMEITDQTQADAYFEKLVEYNLSKASHSRAEAERIERHNLGYFAGYYDGETRERVERLFRCSHPIFGSIKERGEPTPEQAFKAGYEMAKGNPAPSIKTQPEPIVSEGRGGL